MSAKVIAFYGFKGGAGRSMLLGHLATMLWASGKKVLMIDGDLEAPGLGDFFDQTETPTFERWRGWYGLTDLMRDLSVAQVGGALKTPDDRRKKIKELLDVKGETSGRVTGDRPAIRPWTPRGDGFAGEGAIWLLGPGSHRTEGDLGANRYVSNFLDFDWSAFLRRKGGEILASLGESLRSNDLPFDYILLDARTGYNLPSMLLVQHLANVVIGVSTGSRQSLDGMARMLPVIGYSQRQDDPIERLLVLNKTAHDEGGSGHDGGPRQK